MTRAQPTPSIPPRPPLLLRVVGTVVVLAGLVATAVLLWQLWWTDVRAESRSEALVTSLRQDFDSLAAEGPRADQSAATSQEPALGRPTGAIIHLSTLGEVHPVLPGVGADVLDQGVLGRYPGSAGPGEVGNFAVAGHRTTYGRPLWAMGELEEGDPVVVETAEAYHVYVVRRLRVVDPESAEVLAPTPDRPGAAATEPWMVLTTCHPRFSAKERLIGYAALERSVPRSAGPPPELEVGLG